ncbi:hypothetical protein QK903_02270 [Streptococcus thermophilus]|uniref:hypothetical protein n=1 Tax=Streptococcus thermophilus TaxID=1308 RepID=UPI003A80493E
MRLIKNNTELIGIKDQNIKISLVFETDTHIEIQARNFINFKKRVFITLNIHKKRTYPVLSRC